MAQKSDKPTQSLLQSMGSQMRHLRQNKGDLLEKWRGFYGEGMGPGVLDKKMKHLIALAIGISARCDGCIASHMNAALQEGATDEEVYDVMGVAMVMGGGPSLVYTTKAMDALQELRAAESEAAD